MRVRDSEATEKVLSSSGWGIAIGIILAILGVISSSLHQVLEGALTKSR
jgi:hypothetical protein